MNPLTPPSTPRYRAWRNHLWCTRHSRWRRSCRCIRLISWDRCRWPILSAVVRCYNRQRCGMRWACLGRPSILPWWACNGRAIRQRVSWAVHASINSLAHGRFQFNFRQVVFNLSLVNGGWGISYEIALRSMPLDLTDDKSTLVQVMAWCRWATSHYLSQCWPRSLSPYGVTRPQWVNSLVYVVNCFTHWICKT